MFKSFGVDPLLNWSLHCPSFFLFARSFGDQMRTVRAVSTSIETRFRISIDREAVHLRPSNTGIQSRGVGFLSGGIVGGIGENYISIDIIFIGLGS